MLTIPQHSLGQVYIGLSFTLEYSIHAYMFIYSIQLNHRSHPQILLSF